MNVKRTSGEASEGNGNGNLLDTKEKAIFVRKWQRACLRMFYCW